MMDAIREPARPAPGDWWREETRETVLSGRGGGRERKKARGSSEPQLSEGGRGPEARREGGPEDSNQGRERGPEDPEERREDRRPQREGGRTGGPQERGGEDGREGEREAEGSTEPQPQGGM